MLIESKWSEESPSPDLAYFGERLGVAERIQVVARLRKGFSYKGTRVVPACEWLARPLADLL
jgi:hypothetical protein